MLKRNDHILYTAKDFTEDELNRRNVIAVAVIEEGAELCKMCGNEGDQLKDMCAHAVKKQMSKMFVAPQPKLWDLLSD